MKKKLAIGFSFLLVATLYARATAEPPQHLLSEEPKPSVTLAEAVALYEQGVHEIELFEKVLVNATSIVESATARVFLACCLFDAVATNDSEESLQRIYQICNAIPKTKPTQWQFSAAMVITVATTALEGKSDESILLAKKALASIDFDAVEQERSSEWLVLKKRFGDGEYTLREGLKFNIANELMKTKDLRAAENIWRTMTNYYFSDGIAGGVINEYVSQESRALEKRIEDGHGDQHAILVQTLLDGVLDELIRSGEWTSLSMPARLEVVARYATNAPVVATANVLLARHMLDRLSDEAVAGGGVVKVPNRLYRLCRVASDMPPENWQSALSAWIVASAMLLEGKTADARAVAESALKKTDFESLEKLEDKAWLAARKTLGKSPFVLRESLNSVLKLSQMKVEPEVMRQPVAAEIPVN